MLDWKNIDTVLLDMDGTLLDLHFDNYFWFTHVPIRYAEKNNITQSQALTHIKQQVDLVAGKIQWYCLDYWAKTLALPIVELKKEIQEKISLRPDTLPFLDALKSANKQVILVTNAHPDSLSLKVERTALDSHISTLVSTHHYGVTKESQALWQHLQQDFGFNCDKTLFVDDSLVILQSAKQFGIKHLLAVANPDSQKPALTKERLQGFDAVVDYRDIINDIA